MQKADNLVRRDLALMLLVGAVSACQKQGGVIALVGETGSGKSVLAQQYVNECAGAASLYADEAASPPLPVLRGVNVLDEGWRFANARAAIRESVTAGRGVVIVVCNFVEEAIELCAPLTVQIVPVTHWSTAKTAAGQDSVS